MSWIERLAKTYERCVDAPQFAENPPLPVGYTTQQAHLEIVLDGDGNFRRAQVVPREDQTTRIPCTEESGGRAGKMPKNHPLCDKLQYVAGDFRSYGGEVTAGFSKDDGEPHHSFVEDLQAWAGSEFSTSKVKAVLAYVQKGAVVRDLVQAKLLPIGVDGKLLKQRPNGVDGAPPIFAALPPGAKPEDAFVRWRVEIPADQQSAVWEDSAVVKAWRDYYAGLQTKRGLCMVTGKEAALAVQHPAKLRNAGDKAKLISSNDTSGFTFRGRLIDSDQVCGVGFEITQQAHNALRWLLGRERGQAFHNGSQAIVAWSVFGTQLLDPFANSAEMFGLDCVESIEDVAFAGDAGQVFAVKLRKRIGGYRVRLGSEDEIVVMAIDSATPGRMAITFYRELKGSEFYDRLEEWHASCAWPQDFGNGLRFVGAPAPKEISEAACGMRLEGDSGAKLRKATVERLLPCIIDGRAIPRDLVEAVVHRAISPAGLSRWKWEKVLGIACSLYRGYYKQRSYSMGLDRNRTTRDYLFGRLLAVAEDIEARALYVAGEERDTNAAKLMHRFAARPFSTWRTLELSLAPYKARLRSKRPGFLAGRETIIDGIVCAFQPQDFSSDVKLTGEFLLGYHCQRQELRAKPGAPTDDVSDDVDQANSGE